MRTGRGTGQRGPRPRAGARRLLPRAGARTGAATDAARTTDFDHKIAFTQGNRMTDRHGSSA